MRFFKRLFIVLCLIIITAILAGGFCIFYAFKIEPYRLEVNEYTLNSNMENTAEIKIVQFSDLHIKEDFTYKSLEKVVDCNQRAQTDGFAEQNGRDAERADLTCRY